MKKTVVILVIICVAATAGTIISLSRQNAPPSPAPVAESSSEQTQPTTIAAPKQEQPQVILENTNDPTPVLVTNLASSDLNPAISSTRHSRAVDTLVSTQTSFHDRWALLKQLKKSGELDAAIAELNRRVADNPNDVETQNALGEALMAKFPIQDYNETAMLGLQINQSFDAALKIDPRNWEAQFSKAEALAGWPAEMNTGPEVIQQLSSLIDQQETMTPQPQFAQPYVVLGDEYQKLGHAAKAQATWQLGLQKFPNDPTLQKRIANP